ncbi:MAG: NAD-dependent protein deacylase [Nitrospirota bacterium]|jgi:NAD-dependent deacetylase
MEGLEERLGRAAALLREASSVAAFTGAGISTESGIADFRSPGGVWERYRIVTFQEFTSSAEARREYWAMKRDLFGELSRARPNRAHTAIAQLQAAGKLRCVITQNIDGLHQKGGCPEGSVIELHGTNLRAHCLSCGRAWPYKEIQRRLEAGDLDPRCDGCGGLVKPATVSFGQPMPEEEMRRALECARGSDLMFMIGSSLQVEPAASIPAEAHRAGARLIFINRTPTPWDHIAEVIFRESAAEVMGSLVEAL